jgi:hypothetical protein
MVNVESSILRHMYEGKVITDVNSLIATYGNPKYPALLRGRAADALYMATDEYGYAAYVCKVYPGALATFADANDTNFEKLIASVLGESIKEMPFRVAYLNGKANCPYSKAIGWSYLSVCKAVFRLKCDVRYGSILFDNMEYFGRFGRGDVTAYAVAKGIAPLSKEACKMLVVSLADNMRIDDLARIGADPALSPLVRGVYEERKAAYEMLLRQSVPSVEPTSKQASPVSPANSSQK